MGGWNFAEVWEMIAGLLPDALAQVHGPRRYSWAEFDRRANGVARALLDSGAGEQSTVAQYLYNSPEYLESVYGAFKAGLVPLNTNYRYLDDELAYLWENGDVEAVVFHGCFADRAAAARARLRRIRTWLWVDDRTGPCPGWAVPYEDAAQDGEDRPVVAPWGRTGDQLLLLYTGGTTGRPKGVMWRQDDLFRNLVGANAPAVRRAPPGRELAIVRDLVQGPGAVTLPAGPLMHGTGLFTCLMMLSTGGAAVTLESRQLDVEELLATIRRDRVSLLAIAGDVFARPMLAALDADPESYDISSLAVIGSSGVMFSSATKEGLLRHNRRLRIVDALSSSEAVGMGASVSSTDGASATASFAAGEGTLVIADDGSVVKPGSGEIGRVAVGGYQPIGYHKDPEKTAATFVTIAGQRFSVPGDYARLEADGTLTLLGRGAVCINTGGEKVFPEEVEEILKTHPAVADAAVVAVPDDRFGEAVTAIVEPRRPVSVELEPAAVIDHVKRRIAGYKAPRHVLFIDSVRRGPNAKVDYRGLREWALSQLSAAPVRPGGG